MTYIKNKQILVYNPSVNRETASRAVIIYRPPRFSARIGCSVTLLIPLSKLCFDVSIYTMETRVCAKIQFFDSLKRKIVRFSALLYSYA